MVSLETVGVLPNVGDPVIMITSVDGNGVGFMVVGEIDGVEVREQTSMETHSSSSPNSASQHSFSEA